MPALLSFLRFLADEAPALIPAIRDLVHSWCDKTGVDKAELLPALEGSIRDDVAKIDADIDAEIAREFPKPTR